MEVTKGRPMVVPIVVVPIVVLGVGGKLMENCKVSLALLARGLTVLHDDPKAFGRGRLRWWWCVVSAVASSSSCVHHPKIKRV